MALTGDGARDGAELLTCSGLDALQVMEADVKGSRAEKGCQRFDLLDLGDNKFSFYEVYENADAMAYHKTLPHYKGCAQLIAQLGSGVAGPVSPHLSTRLLGADFKAANMDTVGASQTVVKFATAGPFP